MSNYIKIREELTRAKEERDKAREALYQARERLTLQELQEKQTARSKSAGEEEGQLTAKKGPGDTLPSLIKSLEAALKVKQDLVTALHLQLVQLGDPQDLVNNLDDAYPILLTPVRLEARFINETIQVPIKNKIGNVVGNTAQKIYELWVRIFPDDIHSNTHEPLLTTDQTEAGKTYWTLVWNTEIAFHASGSTLTAAEAENRKFGAWVVLQRGYGANQAAWIARRMKPLNWPANLADFATLSVPPQFAAPALKSNSWTLPPRAGLLPERFVVRAYSGTSYKEVVGKVIPDPLISGPDPQQADTSFVESGGKLKVDPDMEWLVDFNKAVANGMGIKLRLTKTEYDNGFDKLLVLGIRLSENQTQGKAAVEQHIDHLHFSPSGFSIVPQGAPTNNTEEGGSGYSSFSRDEAFAFKTEMGDPLVQEQAGRAAIDKSDGEWLAEILGIDITPLEHIAFSNHTDIREAIAINQALSPATVAYYLEQMLHPELTRPVIENTRQFFCQYIRGRGPFPAIRVGNQPYGILPATAYSRMVWGSAGKDQTASGIQTVLQKIHEQWNLKLPKVKTVQDTSDTWQNIFMEIQTLHPTSVQFFNRYLLGPWLHWNLRRFFTGSDAAVRNWWKQNIWDPTEAIRSQLGLFTNRAFILDSYFLNNKAWLKEALIDENPLSEKDPLIDKFNGQNYVEWLRGNSLLNIWHENFGQDPKPKNLLYRLLRHAYLLECLNTATDILNAQGQSIDRKQKEHLNLIDRDGIECELTHKDILFWKDRIRLKDYPEDFELSFLLTSDLWSNFPPFGVFLQQYRDALKILQDLPTARLERCLTEHLDLCTYRMTDWQTGLVNYRLDQMRFPDTSGIRKKGLYTGAYGWLLNLRPKPPRQKVPNAAIPEGFKPPKKSLGAVLQAGVLDVINVKQFGPFGSGSEIQIKPVQISAGVIDFPLTYEPGNAGFIHTPSPGQAVAAAILREGYLSRNGANMEINLSSERVRKALQIIEGIQNGQELAALLGYRFERGIHDISEQNPLLEMNQHIYPLREKFPLTANQLTPNISGNGQAESNNVVHGLNLINHLKTQPISTVLSGLSIAETAAIDGLVGELNDIMDALGDLFMSEGVYQAVLGNFDRAGANLNALTEGKMPPGPQVIETPRTGITVTHRIGILFDTDTTTSQWTAVADTPRSRTAPYLNRWLSQVIDNPEDICCRAVYILNAGTNTETSTPVLVKWSDLQLQPVDLLAIIGDQLADDASELSQRIKIWVRDTHALTDTDPVQVDYRDRTGFASLQTKTFFEILPLVRGLKKTVNENRHLQAKDFLLSADAAPNTTSFDLNELWARVKTAYEDFDALLVPFENSLNAVKNIADPETDLTAAMAFNNLRIKLQAVSLYGLEGSTPKSVAGTTAVIRDILVRQAESVSVDMLGRKKAFRKALFEKADPSVTNPDPVLDTAMYLAVTNLLASGQTDERDLVQWLITSVQKIFGESFRLVPLFQFFNPSEMTLAVTDGKSVLLQDAPPLATEEWLHGAAKVRERVRAYQQVVLFSDTLNSAKTGFDLTPLQLPYQADDRWLGVDFPGERDVMTDTLSLVMRLPDAFDATNTSFKAGIFVDEWLERIPSRQETTGIAFNYEEPGSEPPNVLLLAVPPEITGQWEWEDLMDTLTETIDLAQKRAVDPYLLEQNPGTLFNHFLPALVAAISSRTDKMITLNFNDNNIS